jgi:hypothetical protein
MGVVAGAASYHGLGLSESALFGGSGHAFLLNADATLDRRSIHQWRKQSFDRLLLNMGLAHSDLGHFGPDTTTAEKNRIEKGIRDLMTRGVPCSVKCLEYQLITGYDENAFILDTPPSLEGEAYPDRLDFGSWEQFLGGGHVSFHGFDRTQPRPIETVYRDSLGFALDMHLSSGEHSCYGFQQGLKVYDCWIAAVENGEGFHHRGKTLALVLGECRRMAAGYLGASASLKPEVADSAEMLENLYKDLSLGLSGLPEQRDPAEMKAALVSMKQMERECLKGIETVFNAFDS